VARHFPKSDGLASGVIVSIMISIGISSLGTLPAAISIDVVYIAISAAVLFLLSVFGLLYQLGRLLFVGYAGRFIGRLTIDHHDYIVSSATTRVLADTLGVSQDTIDDWPYWQAMTNSELSFYALSNDARPIDSEDFDDIDNDCLSIMKNPSDDRGNHLEPAPAVASLKLKPIDVITEKLTSSRRMLDDTVSMLDDMGIRDDDHIHSLLRMLGELEKDADKYRDDDVKITTIMNQLDEVAVASKAIHEETRHFYHDITATHEASMSIDQLRQKMQSLRSRMPSLVV
jgi:hypothetical protein